VLLLLLLFSIFLRFCLTNYLNIYQTNLHPICTQLTADERPEVSFFDPPRDVAVATNFVGKINLQSTHLTSVLVQSARSRRKSISATTQQLLLLLLFFYYLLHHKVAQYKTAKR